MMKLIKAVIRPERFDFVKKALEDLGLYAMTVTEVMGRGEQKGISLKYRGGTLAIDLLPKVIIEVVVHDSEEAPVLTAIEAAAKTGKIGDGKIFVIPVERSIRVRTGEVEA
jgi:nitrogen regulatory protein P-II 1